MFPIREIPSSGWFTGFISRHTRVKMKAVYSCLTYVFNTVSSVPTDVQDNRNPEQPGKFLVDRHKEFPVGLGTAKVAGGMVYQSESVSAGSHSRFSRLKALCYWPL